MVETKIFLKQYLKLCKKKNYQPIQEIKPKNKNILDFYVDRIKFDDWMVILECLQSDEYLKTVSIKSRKILPYVIEKCDTEKKARNFKKDTPILTKFLFSFMVTSISELLKRNSILTILNLEGLPLTTRYAQKIAKGLSENISLQAISFCRCALHDEGCEIICSTIKHLPNIESINFSNCKLELKGAQAVSDLIKYQKIVRYSEGWKKSLRYSKVDPDTIPGLKHLNIGNNPDIKDEGLELILEILAEDIWLKTINMENCGITDQGGHAIESFLNINKSLLDFELKNNQINGQILNTIKRQLGYELDEVEEVSKMNLTPRSTIAQLSDKILFLEQQLDLEILNRKQSEVLNEQLHKQMMEKGESVQESYYIPPGYVLIQKNFLERFEELRQFQHEPIMESLQSTARAVHKAKSDTVARTKNTHQLCKSTKSECRIRYKNDRGQKNPFTLAGSRNNAHRTVCGSEVTLRDINQSRNETSQLIDEQDDFMANKKFTTPMSLFMNGGTANDYEIITRKPRIFTDGKHNLNINNDSDENIISDEDEDENSNDDE